MGLSDARTFFSVDPTGTLTYTFRGSQLISIISNRPSVFQ